MAFSSTETRYKPALDESSFQQLLAAAYVVQRHNQEASSPASTPRRDDPLDTSRILGEIAEIQSLIRNGNLNVASACVLIADRLQAMCAASGVSISLVTEGYLDCVAESGTPVKVAGSCIASHSLVATERLKSGLTFQSENAPFDLSLEPGLCQQQGIGALVAGPILRFGELAGLIEVRWEDARSSLDPDLRACRLMAGLASGMLERSIRLKEKAAASTYVAPRDSVQSHEPEIVPDRRTPAAVAPATMDPHIVEANATVTAPSVPSPPPPAPANASEQACPAPSAPECCRVCGKPFEGDESFCGFCSMARMGEAPSTNLQSKWASLWYMQRAQSALAEQHAETEPAPASAESILPLEHDASTQPAVPSFDNRLQESTQAGGMSPFEYALQPREYPRETNYESLLEPTTGERFRGGLQHLARLRYRWREALLGVVVLTLGYGLVSAWPHGSSQMTWLRSLAVRVGIVHGPLPTYIGRPDARVWVDVHTSLYYCQGSDLYGKTPEGEFTTQHDAQSNNIESASNSACE